MSSSWHRQRQYRDSTQQAEKAVEKRAQAGPPVAPGWAVLKSSSVRSNKKDGPTPESEGMTAVCKPTGWGISEKVDSPRAGNIKPREESGSLPARLGSKNRASTTRTVHTRTKHGLRRRTQMPTGAIIARFPRLQHSWLDVHKKLRRYVMLFP